jgi:hypothetical protein
MKLGYTKAKSKTDNDCLTKAEKYLVSLAENATYRIVLYDTDRGDTYGVVVNNGERITVWNAFTEKLESMSQREFERRVR